MTIPTLLRDRLSLPLIGAPMFIVSVPKLVVAQCAAGIIGTMPSLNGRTEQDFEELLEEIEAGLAAAEQKTPGRVAPYGVNLIAHRTNARLQADLEICVRHKVPVIITSLGVSAPLIRHVQAYGGIVLHDVTNMKHARKAIEGGVDGIIAVCNGAGGHAGVLSPIALMRELRAEYNGFIALSGCITDGAGILTALALGADVAYVGTRFVATEEANASEEYKAMIVSGDAEGVVYTSLFSGVPANYLKASIARVGLDPENLAHRNTDTMNWEDSSQRPKAWKEVWGSGQGIGTITDVLATSVLVARMRQEFEEALHSLEVGRSALASCGRRHDI